MEAPAALRARLGWPEDRACGTADGQPVCPAQLKMRLMNFGQHWRTEGVREVDYTLLVPLAVLAEELEREHPSFMADCMAHPDDEPLEAALRARGWPPAAGILGDPELLGLCAAWYAMDVLGRWVGHAWAEGEPAAGRPGFVLNTAAFQACEDGLLRFAGRARQAGIMDVRYQDV